MVLKFLNSSKYEMTTLLAFYFWNKSIKLPELKVTSQNKRRHHVNLNSVNQLVAFLTSMASNLQRQRESW